MSTKWTSTFNRRDTEIVTCLITCMTTTTWSLLTTIATWASLLFKRYSTAMDFFITNSLLKGLFVKDFGCIKWSTSSRWSFRLNSGWGSTEWTHSTLIIYILYKENTSTLSFPTCCPLLLNFRSVSSSYDLYGPIVFFICSASFCSNAA